MQATKENVESISKLGLIAGGGDLPRSVLRACEKREIDVFVVAFEGQSAPETVEGVPHIWVRLGQTEIALRRLKDEGIADLILVGHIRRPSFCELKPDWKTIKFFMKDAFGASGDDALLQSLKTFLEAEGFSIHGAQSVIPDLLAPMGEITGYAPSKGQWTDIHRGVQVLEALGSLDVGQAVVVQQGYVLGIEAAEGTDALIRRCGGLKRKGDGPVLVKLCKASQDQDMDLPTIGEGTIHILEEHEFSGVAVHAGRSFVADIERVSEAAQLAGLFVIGIEPEAIKGV